MFYCPVCNEEIIIVNNICPDCKIIKNMMALNSKKRVLDVLKSIFNRTIDKQENKIKEEIKNEIENKQYNLRNKQIKRGENLN